jgi:hypothetical protein
MDKARSLRLRRIIRVIGLGRPYPPALPEVTPNVEHPINLAARDGDDTIHLMYLDGKWVEYLPDGED